MYRILLFIIFFISLFSGASAFEIRLRPAVGVVAAGGVAAAVAHEGYIYWTRPEHEYCLYRLVFRTLPLNFFKRRGPPTDLIVVPGRPVTADEDGSCALGQGAPLCLVVALIALGRRRSKSPNGSSSSNSNNASANIGCEDAVYDSGSNDSSSSGGGDFKVSNSDNSSTNAGCESYGYDSCSNGNDSSNDNNNNNGCNSERNANCTGGNSSNPGYTYAGCNGSSYSNRYNVSCNDDNSSNIANTNSKETGCDGSNNSGSANGNCSDSSGREETGCEYTDNSGNGSTGLSNGNGSFEDSSSNNNSADADSENYGYDSHSITDESVDSGRVGDSGNNTCSNSNDSGNNSSNNGCIDASCENNGSGNPGACDAENVVNVSSNTDISNIGSSNDASNGVSRSIGSGNEKTGYDNTDSTSGCDNSGGADDNCSNCSDCEEAGCEEANHNGDGNSDGGKVTMVSLLCNANITKSDASDTDKAVPTMRAPVTATLLDGASRPNQGLDSSHRLSTFRFLPRNRDRVCREKSGIERCSSGNINCDLFAGADRMFSFGCFDDKQLELSLPVKPFDGCGDCGDYEDYEDYDIVSIQSEYSERAIDTLKRKAKEVRRKASMAFREPTDARPSAVPGMYQDSLAAGSQTSLLGGKGRRKALAKKVSRIFSKR
ncbi:hypothetical protein H4217_006599 [Coemansia sp. RSA 1939]|nr:hypothetical protein H4217_006599 [Coemansia sp. RSA 1939]